HRNQQLRAAMKIELWKFLLIAIGLSEHRPRGFERLHHFLDRRINALVSRPFQIFAQVKNAANLLVSESIMSWQTRGGIDFCEPLPFVKNYQSIIGVSGPNYADATFSRRFDGFEKLLQSYGTEH